MRAVLSITPADQVTGATIKKIRPMTAKEIQANAWYCGRKAPPVVLELSTGAVLYAMSDEEGNSPGALAGLDKDGGSFMLVFSRRGN